MEKEESEGATTIELKKLLARGMERDLQQRKKITPLRKTRTTILVTCGGDSYDHSNDAVATAADDDDKDVTDCNHLIIPFYGALRWNDETT